MKKIKSKDIKNFNKYGYIVIKKIIPNNGGNTIINIRISNENKHLNFELKNRRNIDRKTINLLRNKEISAIIV